VQPRIGPAAWRVGIAFGAVYLIWGSTYLGIRVAIETLPPLVMAGTRYATAGALLLAWAGPRNTERIRAVHWRSATVVGGLMLVGGNGGVSWSETRVPTGLAAILISTVPLWMVLLDWARQRVRPRRRVLAGIAVGLAGVVLLVGPSSLVSGPRPDGLGVVVLLTGALCWSIGSLRSRSAPLPRAPLVAIAMEMLCGGILLVLAGLLIGEGPRIDLAAVSARSLLAFAYLVVFGSLVGFTCYVWLLRVSSPARVSTYAFVNPVVAVILGWWLGGEPLTERVLWPALFVISAVALITTSRAPARPVPRGEPPAPRSG
jgi:drug/metabolite transporter (DMT)-like permease